jgi:ABC-type multidrug transport system ATPase subunit
VVTAGSATAHPIEFEQVTKRFGKRTVLSDLSFHVPEGTVVGMLGPNGSGKSTAMRVLLGLYSATSGRARVLGQAKGDRGFSDAVRRVGTIIEAPPLYKRLSPLDNLRIRVAATGYSVGDADVRGLLNRVGLAGRLDDPVGDFSLGMRQRVGIALALVGDPKIVVLDEPTNGLDPAGSVEIRKLIQELPGRGITTLVCTHRLAEIESTCDYAVLMQKGRLVAQGSLDEIRARSTVGGHRVQVAPESLERAIAVLTALGLGEVSVDDGDIVLARTVDDPAVLTRALAQQGIYLRGLQTQHANLEEAFLEITGADQEGTQP